MSNSTLTASFTASLPKEVRDYLAWLDDTGQTEEMNLLEDRIADIPEALRPGALGLIVQRAESARVFMGLDRDNQPIFIGYWDFACPQIERVFEGVQVAEDAKLGFTDHWFNGYGGRKLISTVVRLGIDGQEYMVRPEGDSGSCNCPVFRFEAVPCPHIPAALMYLAGQRIARRS